MRTTRKTQRNRILHFLKLNGSINRLQAINELKILELPARICEIRKDGFIIEKIRTSNDDLMIYKLVSEPQLNLEAL